jgi:hypothetical protein
MAKNRSAQRTLMENPDGTRPLCRPGHRWENNIKMDVKEIGWEQVG